MGASKVGTGKAVSGQVMTVEEQEAEEKRIAIREQKRMSIAGAVFSRLSRLPFVNIWLRKKVETSREVIREEAGLFKDLRDHEESFNALLNIDNILREDDAQFETNALAAERRLAEEQRRTAARETDDEIFRNEKEAELAKSSMKKKYELRVLEANYKIQLDPLEKAVKKFEKPEPEPKKKTTRGRTEKQKKREEVLNRYDKEMARIDAMKKSDKVKAALRKAAEAEKEKAMVEIENEP
jgi:hypothetical protein